MQKTSSKKVEWKRYKEVCVPWAVYDAHRLDECKHVLDLRSMFTDLDRPAGSCLLIVISDSILRS